MADPAAIEAKRKDHAAAVAAAWADLALNKSFEVAFTDAQARFGMLASCFQAKDNFNTHAAAFRDGQKDVLKDFARRLGWGRERLEDDESSPRPTTAG